MIYIKYGKSTIISIIPSTYLTGKIIIRDLLGKHAWLISQHRVLDYNTLKTINHNDKSAIKNYQLKLSNKLTAEETKLIASDLKQLMDSIELIDPKQYNKEVADLVECDVFTKVIQLLCEKYPEAENVY